MDIQLDQISKTEALIKINLIEGDYKPKIEEKIKDYTKKAQIKGFRQGKVPRGVIQKMYGKSILVEEINQLVSSKVMEFIKEKEIQILGEPLPNQDKVASLDWEEGKVFDFEYNIGIAPEFKVTVDKKVKVDTFSIKIDEKIMTETMDNLKSQFGEMTNPEASEEGDSLYGTILVEGQEENEEAATGTVIEIDSTEKKGRKTFLGQKIGDIIEFDPNKEIKDVAARAKFLGENAGLEGAIKFEVKNVNRVIAAELNQELFDKVFGKDLVKSEEEFLEKVKSTIAENYNKETDGYTDVKIKEKLVESTKMELPDEFLKRWLKTSNTEITQEQLDQEYPIYAKDLKWSMVKNAVAKDNDIKIEHEEVVEEAKNMIRQQFGSMGMSDQMESSIDSFADNYLKGEEGKNYMKLHETVINNKVTSFIKENITIKEKAVTVDEYKEKA
ncbi:MAG: trigger factor [Reichenbachiella sp.]